MRKIVFVLVALTGTALAAMLYQQLFVERSLGPAALVATSALGVLLLSLVATLLLIRTRHRDIVGSFGSARPPP